MSISQSERRSDPQSILLRGQKREVFALSATYPLIEVPLKINRYIWHSLLEKIVPKPRQRTLSAPSQRLENSISRFDRLPTCPAATTGCYGPPLCIRPIGSMRSISMTIAHPVAQVAGCSGALRTITVGAEIARSRVLAGPRDSGRHFVPKRSHCACSVSHERGPIAPS